MKLRLLAMLLACVAWFHAALLWLSNRVSELKVAIWIAETNERLRTVNEHPVTTKDLYR